MARIMGNRRSRFPMVALRGEWGIGFADSLDVRASRRTSGVRWLALRACGGSHCAANGESAEPIPLMFALRGEHLRVRRSRLGPGGAGLRSPRDALPRPAPRAAPG